MPENANQQASYRRVPILRTGVFTDERGRQVEFTAAGLASLALSYETTFHAAPLTLEHGADGPALGIVSALSFDGRYLYADVEGVPEDMADALGAGRYPFRSAEVYPDLEGRGPYLRALTLLGARPPAVKGLPGWPAQESLESGVQSLERDPNGGTRSTPDARRQTPAPPLTSQYTRPLSLSRARERHNISLSEVRMPTATKDKPPAGAADDTIRLAEENLRLSEENRRLRADRLRRDVALFLSELREGGQLTPAMEAAGVEEALVAAEEQAAHVVFPDGKKLPLSSVIKEVLRALPLSYYPKRVADEDANAAPPELSAEEMGIAAALGLTDSEYASIKSSQ